jgi:hypothetical protein
LKTHNCCSDGDLSLCQIVCLYYSQKFNIVRFQR